MLIALKNVKDNKTPGEDGISPEFYKMFINRIKDPMFEMISETFMEEQLEDGQSEGIINLIPKPLKDNRHLKNLRPITLLNTDYKLIEKMVANRLDPSLGELIHRDQTGFMKDRRISINIRKIFDLMYFAKKEKLESFILSLDFEKCFDKIESCAILGALWESFLYHICTGEEEGTYSCSQDSFMWLCGVSH